ncbi:MAG TPA: polysaccharide deacetylase family protein [Prosthecobacter sp.]
MSLSIRCLFLSFLVSSAQMQAQEPAPAPVPAPAAAVPQEVIRKAIPVEEDPVAMGASLAVESLPRELPADFKTVYTRCEIPERVIALTFDDGPHPEYTPRLLDYLRERNIKATFFMVGRNVRAFPAIVRRMAEEGHEVANHSWSHPLLTSLGNTKLDAQIKQTHDAIVAACGKVPVLYRPPYGQARMTQRKRIRDTFGYAAILWDVDPLDWQSPRTSQKVHDRVLAATRPGSIILCHDIHETTVAAMPGLLDELKNRGFQFATVTQLLQLGARHAAPATAAGDAAAPLPTIPAPEQAGTPTPASAGDTGAPASLTPGGVAPGGALPVTPPVPSPVPSAPGAPASTVPAVPAKP